MINKISGRLIIEKVSNLSLLKILFIVFLLALIPRVAITIIAPHPPSAHWDVAHDVLIARCLASGNGFANEPGHPTAYRYPLLPLILSLFFRLFGERYIPFLLFQSLLSALIAPMMAWLAYRVGGRNPCWLTGILVALNTELISISRMMLTETIYSFLISMVALALVVVFDRKKLLYFFLVGVLLGLASLCRPVAAGWGVIISLILLLRKKYKIRTRIYTVILFTAGFVIAFSPWVIRNSIVMGSPEISTSSGITFWLFGHNDAEYSDETTVVPEEFAKVNIEVDPKNYFTVEQGDPSRMLPIFNMEPRYQAYSFEQSVVDRVAELGEVEANRELNAMAIEYILANPLKTLGHSFTHLFFTLAYTEMNGKINIILTFVFPFVLLGGYRFWKESKTAGLVIISSLVSMLIVNFLFYFDHRFRLPYQPFLMILGAFGIVYMVTEGLSKKEKILFLVWMVFPIVANYFLLFGNQSG